MPLPPAVTIATLSVLFVLFVLFVGIAPSVCKVRRAL
jgi:hypothetical protein